MFSFPFSSLLHFSKVARPVKFLLSPPLTPPREFHETTNFPRTFDYRRLLHGSHRGDLQKSVHAQRSNNWNRTVRTVSAWNFPRSLLPSSFLSVSALHLSLSFSLCLASFREEWEQRKRKKRAFTGIVFACARSKPDARKGGEEHRFSAGGSAFASKRLTSATLQPRPIYTTIDREKPVNRKLVKFDP